MRKKIVLDAGHALTTGGKQTCNGSLGVVKEWTMNNAVCDYIAELLKIYDVEITRVDDITGKIDVPVQERSKKINQIHPDLFISIHHNANTGQWGEWTGTCAFYSLNKPQRDADLAKALSDEMQKQVGLKNRGALQDYSYLGFTLHMLRETNPMIPSVLIEGGFMDSIVDYPVITSENGQRAYAQAVANVCISYLNLPSGESTKKIDESQVVSIMGDSVLHPAQMAAFLLSKNPKPALSSGCTALQLAEHYISEGNADGVRGDIAFCQAMQETGYFKFGGDVLPEQNNYCGLGATNTTAKGKGAWFESPQMGVRAQIQHLKAYASKDALRNPCIDPRFSHVSRGIAPHWSDLNGRWAFPGNNYGQSILKIYNSVANYKNYTVNNPIDNPVIQPDKPKNGDPLGDVFYSDITAYINGNAIPASVIKDKTLVAVEDLANYGFDIIWNNGDRTLQVERNENKKIKPLTVEKDINPPGTIKCKYVYTDIKTYLSGEETESFSIDGFTLIDFELLKKYGTLNWRPVARELHLTLN